MGRNPRNSVCVRDQIVRFITDEIVSGRRAVGTKLLSQRVLAARFNTSRFPVVEAVRLLMSQGYVEPRHGSGVFVRDRTPGLNMSDSAVLCMNATGHIYGDMAGLLFRRLQGLGLFASVLDTGQGRYLEMLGRARHSQARFIMANVSGAMAGPMLGSIDASLLAHKHVVAILAWECELFLDKVHRILVNHAAAAKQLVDHLWSAGHRCVLIAGPPNMIENAAVWNGIGPCSPIHNVQGTGFAAIWAAKGGKTVTLHCVHDRTNGPACDEESLLAVLSTSNPPTAVVGLRDVDAWDVQDVLLRRRPGLTDHLGFYGDGDTPWSQMGHPPFSTRNWNLEEIADIACGVIRDIQEGKSFRTPTVRMVSTRLVLRAPAAP
ncbi:MAG: GntR family transcriptional regulator [bacterium]